ncbi:hypothetical protein [Kitasatospora griseola]|uniref:hypothetical protein n=1 Tax=Kitasatospora griseola TaxID=2064 RepID=UPI00380A32DD
MGTGVPTSWLNSALQAQLPAGMMLMDRSGTDPSRYVMVGGAALHISAAEWTAEGSAGQALTGVPGEWLAGAAASTVADGTLIKGQAGADPSIYVMIGGAGLPLTNVEFTTSYAGRCSACRRPGRPARSPGPSRTAPWSRRSPAPTRTCT